MFIIKNFSVSHVDNKIIICTIKCTMLNSVCVLFRITYHIDFSHFRNMLDKYLRKTIGIIRRNNT